MKKAVSVFMITILALSLFASINHAQQSDSPISEGPTWEKDYDTGEDFFVYKASDVGFFVKQEYNVSLLNKDGEEKWSKSFTNRVNSKLIMKDKRVYVQTGPMDDNRYKLRCLDSDDGSEIWNTTIEDTARNLLVNGDDQIFLPYRSGDEVNLKKISSEGKIQWTENYSKVKRVFYGNILKDGKIALLCYHSNPDYRILGISPEGKLKWNITKKHLNIMQKSDKSESLYAKSRHGIYNVDSEGNIELIYELENKSDFLSSFVVDSNKIYFTEQNENNDNISFKSISKDGELLMNTSLNRSGNGGTFHFMYAPGNERIYFQYWNLTDMQMSVSKISAYTLDGDLEWTHEYDNSTIYKYHVLTEDGLIVTATDEGKVYAYQGHEPKEESEEDDPYLALRLGLVFVIIVIFIYYLSRGEE